MKYNFIKGLLIICFLLSICIFADAQELKLEAVKKNHTYKFQSNNSIQIIYRQDKTVKQVNGRFEIQEPNGIYILPYNHPIKEFVALDSIISIMKISKTKSIGLFGNLPISIEKAGTLKSTCTLITNQAFDETV